MTLTFFFLSVIVLQKIVAGPIMLNQLSEENPQKAEKNSTSLICSICWFLWCKYSYPGQFRATNTTSYHWAQGLGEMHTMAFAIVQATAPYLAHMCCSVFTGWVKEWIIISSSHYSITGNPLDILGRFIFFLLSFDPLSCSFFSPGCPVSPALPRRKPPRTLQVPNFYWGFEAVEGSSVRSWPWEHFPLCPSAQGSVPQGYHYIPFFCVSCFLRSISLEMFSFNSPPFKAHQTKLEDHPSEAQNSLLYFLTRKDISLLSNF